MILHMVVYVNTNININVMRNFYTVQFLGQALPAQ